MAARSDRPPGVYRHYKGSLYILYSWTFWEKTLDVHLHYFSMESGLRFSRLHADFHETLPGGVDRFTWKREATPAEMLLAQTCPQPKMAPQTR